MSSKWQDLEGMCAVGQRGVRIGEIDETVESGQRVPHLHEKYVVGAVVVVLLHLSEYRPRPAITPTPQAGRGGGVGEGYA